MSSNNLRKALPGAFVVIVAAALAGCGPEPVVCGDGKAGVSEECDDGNRVDTDACTNTCEVARCGDGIVQAGVEACDDGNQVDTDACRNNCALASCGDGVVEQGEACDDGNAVETDACRNDCTAARCGDGVVEDGVEACDDGNLVDTDACRNDCTAARCGDGVVEDGIEACDDGNTDDGDGCTNACTTARCGDGVVHVGYEACDDGNAVDGDGCTNACTVATCGDSVVHEGVEACDDGNAVDTDSCVHCELAICGDGATHAGVEACDDGNTVEADACRNDCTAARCGDAVTWAGVEACDDGNTVETDACRNDCTAARCGDAVTWAGVEACDDGNSDDTDACLTTCQAATCGDGHAWAGVEACDDGNSDDTDACLTTCQAAACGDGHTWAGVEACDDGNGVDTDSCTNACTVARCGDRIVETGVEACDDGNTVETDACRNDCTAARCGDGVTWAGAEACDDGNSDDTDACLTTCQAAACGDGHTWAGVEACDDGNGVDTDACTNACTVARCGDGIVEAGVEACDDGNAVETDACRSDCTAARCGDGVTWAGVEECDDGNAINTDGCRNSCRLPACGDEILDPGETCDGAALGTATCETQGYRPGGVLGCSGTCGGYLTAGCCGDGIVGGGEQCDDGNAANGDGCENDCTRTAGASGPPVTVCRALAPIDGVCRVTAGTNGAKLITGNVLVPGNVFRGGQVLVDGAGMVACVGCDCTGNASAAAATQISCPQGVVTPGLINAHDHITYAQNSPAADTGERYEHRHDWRVGLRGHTKISVQSGASTDQVRWGELRFVLGGATSTIGSGVASGFLRNLDKAAGLEGLTLPAVTYQTFPLDDSSGILRNGNCDYGPGPDTEATIAALPAYFPHVGEGIDPQARNEFFCTSSSTFDVIASSGTGPAGLSHDLTQPQSAFIHGVGLKPMDFGQMSYDGTSLIWSPRSNISLYGDTAVVTVAQRMGVNIALGTDWMPSGSMNMLRELRCVDDWNRERLGGFFSDEQLWLLATRNPAIAAHMQSQLGVLQVGAVGDLAIFDGRAHADHRAVLDGTAAGVALVLRGGKVLTGDAAVVSAIPGSGVCDALDVCGAQKRVCAQSDIGETLSQLQANAGNIYGAFYCGVPPGEPTCVPSRPAAVSGSTLYTGAITAGDSDGDGIPNASDDCANVFNPIRPEDNGAQADFDGDGVGDACDVCPMTPGSTVCAPFDPNDSDGDGVPNVGDNCPMAANPTQADADGDLKGDACDPCPSSPNPGAMACPASIYDIKLGLVPVGSSVSISNALVTGKYASGFFLQVKEGDPGYGGPDYSGIFVYSPGATVSPGDRVSIDSAGVATFGGQLELSGLVGLTVTSSGNAPPAPTLVLAYDVQTGGPRSDALESVLVQVSNVTVTSITPTPGTGDTAPTNEYVVDGPDASADLLRVNDILYLTSPFPQVGENFASITGVLEFRNGNFKIEPRSAADVVAGAPVLGSIGPAGNYTREGYADRPTFPQAVTVRLSRYAAADTFVAVTSSDPALTVTGGGAVIPAGSISAPVLVSGVTASAAVTLTATLGTVQQATTVRVLGASEAARLTALTPALALVAPGGTLQLTAVLDIPAAAATDVALGVSPSGAALLPAVVTVPADATSAPFDYTDLSIASSAVVTATLGADSATASVLVSAGPAYPVINEVDYDQPSTDTTEFIELFNGSPVPIDLANLAIVLVNGANNTEYQRDPLGPGTLSPGQYLVLANAALPALPAGVLRITIPSGTVQNGSPDGVALIDVSTNTVLDALSYAGSITAANITGFPGPVNLVEGTAATAVDTGASPGSLVRLPNGTDTNNANADWRFTSTPTPGAANVP